MKRTNNLTKAVMAVLSLASAASPAFGQQTFLNWSSVNNGTSWTYSNTSAAGTITATTAKFAPAPSNALLPGITNTPITSGFNVGNVGSTVVFNFSNGYGWGNGGQLIIGNIHNYFEYTLSAWNFAGNQIDVNQWPTVADYPLTWTPASKNNRAPSGLSSKFWVYDTASSPGSGQGGVIWLSGLKNVRSVSLTLTSNSLAPNGQGSDFILFNFAVPAAIREHCVPKGTAWDSSPLSSSWDTANCYVKPVVSGATPFIWNNGFYVQPDKSTQCAQGAGTWDTQNCYYGPKPANGFIVNDGLYIPKNSSNACTSGTWDGTGCLIKKAPWGTHAFEWSGNWYFTTIYTCKDGSYDSANCYIGRPPTGAVAFLYANNFYWAE